VRPVTSGELDRLSGGVEHQGVVAVADPYRYRDLDDLLDGVPPGEAALFVAIDGVTDPRNLGAVARTAEAVGAHGLIVTARRSVGVTPAAEKAAAGALAHLPVAEVPNLVRALRTVGEAGVWSVGLDADGPVSLHDCDLLTEPVVLVVGAEGRGLGRLTAETCDLLVALRLRGRIASLNAAVAAGIALYEVLRRRDA
jgi:23S rRNA (guanosine2251-2'-O)-methyltransferase